MYYDIYDTIAKAKEFTITPREHFVFLAPFHISFSGKNGAYNLKYTKKRWNCDCRTFKKWRNAQVPGYTNFCAHVVAVEKICRESLLNIDSGWVENKQFEK